MTRERVPRRLTRSYASAPSAGRGHGRPRADKLAAETVDAARLVVAGRAAEVDDDDLAVALARELLELLGILDDALVAS